MGLLLKTEVLLFHAVISILVLLRISFYLGVERIWVMDGRLQDLEERIMLTGLLSDSEPDAPFRICWLTRHFSEATSRRKPRLKPLIGVGKENLAHWLMDGQMLLRLASVVQTRSMSLNLW